MTEKPSFTSIIVPVYNEAENLPLLIRELEPVMGKRDYEIIFIDDGSSDGSFDILKENRKRNGRIKIIQFGDNFGQHAALTAGYQAAKGDIIVTMDADLQNDPANVPEFIEKIEKENYSAAFGWRTNRENGFILRRLPSKFFNWIRNRGLQHPLHDYGCALNAFSRKFVDELADSPERLKHITTYIAGKKEPYVEVRIKERSRHAGKSRYNLMRLLQLGIDLLITTSTKPVATSLLVFTAAVSFVLFALSLIVAIHSLLSGAGNDFHALIHFIFPFLFFVSSLVCGVLALINEKVSALLRHTHKKPLYIIKENLD